MDHGKIRGPAQTRFFNDFGPETKETNKLAKNKILIDL